MQTREFRSDEEVEMLVHAFEQRTIPAKHFSHAAHIAVGLAYLAEFPPDIALNRMRQKIRAFAAHHGASDLYHETLTTFWMRLLEHLGHVYNIDQPLYQRINAIVDRWGTRAPVEAHYSPETIKSQKARKNWVPPDRLPLPF